MLSKKSIFILIIVIIIAGGITYTITPRINFYFEKKQIAKAAAGLPFQFGGTITYYQPICVSDPETGVCHNCPVCTGATGPYACNAYSQIEFTPAIGSQSIFVCPFKSFVYSGGVPRPGGQILGGGASPSIIWVAGVSSF